MSSEASRPSRKGKPNHPIDFKRRLAQQACEANISVSGLAREHGINTNMLFRWRRQYRAGLFNVPSGSAALLPVSLVSPPSTAEVAPAAPAESTGDDSSFGIEVVFTDCTVRVGRGVDLAALRAVLALLRQ